MLGFGYEETADPLYADERNFYKVEQWDTRELRAEKLLHASNDPKRAQAVFDAAVKRRPRGHYMIRQRARIIDRWPLENSGTVNPARRF